MALSDFEMSYRGLVIGKDQPVKLASLSGLEDLSIRSGDRAIPRGDGDIKGLHTIASREVIMELTINEAARSTEFADLEQTVLATFSRQDQDFPLGFKWPGQSERFVNARVIGRALSRQPNLTFGHQPLTVRLRAADPRIYDVALKDRTLSIYDGTGGGTDYGEDYGIDFTVDNSSEKILTNNGDANAYPLIRFYGPPTGTITGVTLTNTTTGGVLDITAAILSSEILVADMDRYIRAETSGDPLIHIGGSNRYGDWELPRDPFYLAPGDNALRYEITGTSTDAVCNLSFRDTWL